MGRIKSENVVVAGCATPHPKLVGIARMAAGSPRVVAKNRAEYFELESRSILNRCSNPMLPFRWTINPYRGCEIGCKYCYARYTHEFMGLDDGKLFEQRIYAKKTAPEILRRELARRPKGGIAIGTATDPYQPAERRFGITRKILEVFAQHRGLDLSVTTKSDLVVRDLDLLSRIHQGNSLSVNITVTTLDEDLARKLEPLAPRPELRIQAVAKLAEAGIPTGVYSMPILPLLTDSLRNLDRTAAAAAAAGATYFGGRSLFLMPSAQREFFPFLEKEFPRIAKRYRQRYESDAYVKKEYDEWLRERIATVREKHGLNSTPPRSEPQPKAMQLELLAVDEAS